MRRLAGILIASCMMVLSNPSYAAGRIFYDGFEDGTTNKWQQDSPHNRCQVVQTSADGVAGPFSGTRMARCNWNSTDYESLTINTTSYTNELFIRVRLRVDNNLSRTGGSPTKILRFFFWDGKVYHDLFEVIDTGNGLSNRGNTTNSTFPTYWGGAPGDLTGRSSEWHKVEYYIHQANGTVKVWHDGILVRNDTGYDFEGVKWSPFYLTSNWSDPHDATNYVYFDEFEVYSDSGTGATGLMSNATICQGTSCGLSAPQALRLLP